jgi:hypothetical protein
MTSADVLMAVGMIAGGLSIVGLGFALLAARRGDQWMDGYKAGKLAGDNQVRTPAPVIVLTQPAQPAQPTTVDAAWRPVQPAQPVRRFVVVGESEQPRRLDGR